MSKNALGARFGIGGKLVLGFGVLIGISFFVGILAIGSLLVIQSSSDELSRQFLPEAILASEVERETLKTMLNVRGYWLTSDKKYLAEAEKSLAALDLALNDLQVLLAKSPKLLKLGEMLPKARASRDAYVSLLEKTKTATGEILSIRTEMDSAAKEFTTQIAAYLASEQAQLITDAQSGARASAIIQRGNKISGATQISTLGQEVRVANFKTQAARDPSYIKAALPSFERIKQILASLTTVTSRLQDRQDLASVQKAAEDYRDALNRWLAVNATLDALALSRTEAGDSLGLDAEQTSIAGVTNSQTLARSNSDIVSGSIWSIVLGLMASVVIGALVALALVRSITGPLRLVTALSKKVTEGDFAITKETTKNNDELGLLVQSFYLMVDGLKAKANLVESIASGILTDTIPLAGEDDGLGRSLKRMQDSLNDILSQVNSAVDQMASGSDQVSTAAQSLSQGATEQASSLEEISASSSEIHSQSKQNAENAMTANQLAKQASASAQQGNQQMKDLLVLLEKMTRSSEETKSIVKTIDDIAFQVNLLALNANVEAARAGKYGKGFAVVAEEVRNLAVRSATAVNETTRMVEESLLNIQDVNATALKTGEQLNGILSNSNRVADFLEEIAASSQEQAKAMGQINGGLEQIDQVTQSNTASAEQSASASEELSGQAQQLKVMISRFQLKGLPVTKAPLKIQPGQRPMRVEPPRGPVSRAPSRLAEPPRKPQQPNDIILNDDFDTF